WVLRSLSRMVARRIETLGIRPSSRSGIGHSVVFRCHRNRGAAGGECSKRRVREGGLLAGGPRTVASTGLGGAATIEGRSSQPTHRTLSDLAPRSRVKLTSKSMLRLRRLLAQRVAPKIACRQQQTAMLSVTFDDFPRSSARVAGAILSDFNLRATYY